MKADERLEALCERIVDLEESEKDILLEFAQTLASFTGQANDAKNSNKRLETVFPVHNQRKIMP